MALFFRLVWDILSIEMIIQFLLNARMESGEQNQPDDNGIDSLMQWLQ